MPVEHLNLITKYPDEAEAVINQLFVNPDMKPTKWYPTPETCSEPDKLNAIERRIYDELLAVRELEKLDLSQSDEHWLNFLKNFTWDDSLLTPSQRLQVEELLVEYNSIFTKHRFDIGMNTDFKVRLTPQHEEPVYSQSLPTPTNLKDDLLVESVLMQEYGIITTLPHSKYSSPIFAQRKPNGKLRISVDLRRINHLIKNDYGEHNHPLTTIADAAQTHGREKYLCKLDCSQAYHCIPIADEQSVQLLSFNFGSRTVAFLRLAQGLDRSLSAFTSDGKGMKFTICERTAASEDFIANDNHLTYRLTDVDEPIQLVQFIRKVPLSRPVMSQVSPAEGIDLIESQKTDWNIQKMIEVLEGSEILQHPVNMQDQFFQKLHKNCKRLQVVNGVMYRQFFDHTGLV